MALRGFGFQTFTGSAQPLIGTKLLSAVYPSPDPHTGRLDPGSQPSSALVSASNFALFRVGDHVQIGAPSTFIQGNTVAPDGGSVQQVNASASNILVTGLLRNHAAGEWVVLSMPCALIDVQSNSSSLYVGEDSTVGIASSTLVAQLTAAGPFSVGTPSLGNMIETQHVWLNGTSSNYLPYLLTI